ncbi:MAG: hypothetical protein KDA66_01285 [Planctomycetaceae bacterium]|nr:hypothetical protein [Planctomycetaceae bacterium]
MKSSLPPTKAERLLITGFPPFHGHPFNPTQRIVEAIQDGTLSVPSRFDVFTSLLPVEYVAIESEFTRLIDEFQPTLVLSFGVGHSGALLHLERWGVNCDDAPVPDNAGVIRTGQEIVDGGPSHLPATIDVDALHVRLQEQDVDAVTSDSAGRFLCNHLLYYGLYSAQSQPVPYRMTFVHVRPLETSPDVLPQELALLFNAVEKLLECLY